MLFFAKIDKTSFHTSEKKIYLPRQNMTKTFFCDIIEICKSTLLFRYFQIFFFTCNKNICEKNIKAFSLLRRYILYYCGHIQTPVNMFLIDNGQKGDKRREKLQQSMTGKMLQYYLCILKVDSLQKKKSIILIQFCSKRDP